MRVWKVTIPFKKHPWYSIDRVEAPSKTLAIEYTLAKLYIEQPDLRDVKHQKPIAKETL